MNAWMYVCKYIGIQHFHLYVSLCVRFYLLMSIFVDPFEKERERENKQVRHNHFIKLNMLEIPTIKGPTVDPPQQRRALITSTTKNGPII